MASENDSECPAAFALSVIRAASIVSASGRVVSMPPILYRYPGSQPANEDRSRCTVPERQRTDRHRHKKSHEKEKPLKNTPQGLFTVMEGDYHYLLNTPLKILIISCLREHPSCKQRPDHQPAGSLSPGRRQPGCRRDRLSGTNSAHQRRGAISRSCEWPPSAGCRWGLYRLRRRTPVNRLPPRLPGLRRSKYWPRPMLRQENQNRWPVQFRRQDSSTAVRQRKIFRFFLFLTSYPLIFLSSPKLPFSKSIHILRYALTLESVHFRCFLIDHMCPFTR